MIKWSVLIEKKIVLRIGKITSEIPSMKSRSNSASAILLFKIVDFSEVDGYFFDNFSGSFLLRRVPLPASCSELLTLLKLIF